MVSPLSVSGKTSDVGEGAPAAAERVVNHGGVVARGAYYGSKRLQHVLDETVDNPTAIGTTWSLRNEGGTDESE